MNVPSVCRDVFSTVPLKCRNELNDRQSTSTVTGWWRRNWLELRPSTPDTPDVMQP